MLLLVCLFTSVGLMIAQTPKKVTGVVISEEDDQPVVGASVLIKGTTLGTVTNIDGQFTIDNVRVCRNDASSFLYKQSPDFPKPGLCHVQKNLHL